MRLAVIPARGGSKRIPRKNIREFAGRPMIEYSIECALESRLFDRVIVSTDDEEIAGTARSAGAEVPFERPPELSDDHTSTSAVIAHAVRWIQQSGSAPEVACCIYATAPFMEVGDLTKASQLFETGRWKFVFAATTFGAPIYRAFERTPDGGARMFFPEHFPTRSQDLPLAWHDAAQFYFGRADAWLGMAPVFSEQSTFIEIPRWRVHDIDTPEDWERAEVLWRVLRS